MSHLTITITSEAELIFSSNQISENFSVNGVLGEYEFSCPAFKGGKKLTDKCKLGIKVFETSGAIKFKKGEHSHLYHEDNLCLIHKYYHKSEGTIEGFIRHLLINYIAGYYNFRTNGKWFNEDNKKTINDFKEHDKLLLEKYGFNFKPDSKQLRKQVVILILPKDARVVREREKEFNRYVKQSIKQ